MFDAWGNVLVQDGTGNTLNGLSILDRGYTGHEHLQSVGLIHMNGRLYDAKLHRFLQPDNYVQDPGNTQNYNRYGYVLNNPLKYTDWTGEKWKIKLTWSDLFAGVSILAGTALVIFGGPAGVALGTKLIVAGGTHFLATTAMVITQGKSWTEASNYIGFQSPTITIDTGWGDSKPNGVNQNEPVVKPKTVEDVKKDKGEDSFHPGQLLPNFKSDIGFDILKFKGLHYGVPEFETSLLNGRGAITPGPISFYPTRGSYDPNYSTHEPGHALQFALMGVWYYPIIALPSIVNANSKNAGDSYTEKTANQLWYWWSGEKDSRNKRYRD